MGQLIAVVDISNMNPGWNEVIFNAKDMYDQTLASGIYLVQLQVGQKIYNTLKITIIK